MSVRAGVLGVVGTALLLLVAYDIVVTAVTPARGAGPVTTRLGRLIASCIPAGAARESQLAAALGPIALTSTLAVWATLFASGWWALLAIWPVEAPDGLQAGPLGLLAYTLTSISSLGTGYLQPKTEIGHLLAALASLSGLGLLTLTVTYVLPVVTAVSQRRLLARRISALGASSTELIELLAGSPSALAVIADVAANVRAVTQDHLAYPVLHHFRASSREAALAPNLAALDEAVTALENRSHEDPIDPIPVRALRVAVGDLLTVTEQYLRGHTAEDAPPWPDHVAPDEEDAISHDEHEQRRRRLAAYVREDGWDWDRDVHPPITADGASEIETSTA